MRENKTLPFTGQCMYMALFDCVEWNVAGFWAEHIYWKPMHNELFIAKGRNQSTFKTVCVVVDLFNPRELTCCFCCQRQFVISLRGKFYRDRDQKYHRGENLSCYGPRNDINIRSKRGWIVPYGVACLLHTVRLITSRGAVCILNFFNSRVYAIG